MPYIEADERAYYCPSAPAPASAGFLNYQITVLIDNYMKTNGLNYANINNVIGALEGAKLEFYRRVAVPYEDHKITVNGDVY